MIDSCDIDYFLEEWGGIIIISLVVIVIGLIVLFGTASDRKKANETNYTITFIGGSCNYKCISYELKDDKLEMELIGGGHQTITKPVNMVIEKVEHKQQGKRK